MQFALFCVNKKSLKCSKCFPLCFPHSPIFTTFVLNIKILCMASVSIIFRDDRINKKGEAPINFFIIKDRKITKVSTGIKIHSDFWDDDKKRVKSKHKNSAHFNSLIANKFAELQDKVLENLTIAKSLTSRQLKEDLFGKAPLDFFAHAQKVLDKYKSQGQVASHDRCKAITEKLKRYMNNSNLYFQEITPDFLAKYEKHLRGKDYNNSTNTIHANFKFIRQLFNDVVYNDLVDIKHDPFKKYKIKTEKTQRQYLTEDELLEIEKVDCSSGLKLELHRDMFVFAAYCGGLRVSDVLKLKWKNIDKTHINLTIQKTGGQLSIKIPDKAFKILENYKPKKVEKEDYVFPMLPNGLKEDDLVLLDSEISKATAYINKNLKAIATKAEIGKILSFHISRHTWATRALRKGISIDKVSKLMGHAAIKETQIYAKIVSEELDKAMDVFND